MRAAEQREDESKRLESCAAHNVTPTIARIDLEVAQHMVAYWSHHMTRWLETMGKDDD